MSLVRVLPLFLARPAPRTSALAHVFNKPTAAVSSAAVRNYGSPVDTKPDITLSQGDEPVEMENPYKKERKQCILCKMNITPDYKNVKLLSQFQSPYTGRIYGRHITGLCQSKQKQVQEEIVKAQNCAYMPYYNKDKSFLKDPKLFDPEKPLRPHRF